MRYAAGLLVLCLAGCGGPAGVDVKPPIELGRAAIEAKDLQTAITHFTLAIGNARDYVFTEALLERAECYLEIARRSNEASVRADNLGKALEDFGEVLRQETLAYEERARALVGKGHCLLVDGNTKGAEAAFGELLEIEPHGAGLTYHLEALRELGRLVLGNDIDSVLASSPAAPSPALAERLRRAQRLYSAGLEVDDRDGECNLFKGICLHARGLHADAIAYLLKACDVNDFRTPEDPRAHYYLAQALEKARGPQLGALVHYEKAVEQDAHHIFKPLHSRLVDLLLVYRDVMDGARFDRLLQSVLSYSGTEADYWSSVEELASRIEATLPEKGPEVCNLVRALSRARMGNIPGAVEAATQLRKDPDFLLKLDKIFPPGSPQRPAYLYGRALSLQEAKRGPELAAFFKELKLSPEDRSAREYQPILLLKGQSTVAAWREASREPTPLTPEQKTERDNELAEAKALFEKYLELHADEPEGGSGSARVPWNGNEVRLFLAEALELMGLLQGAANYYISVANADPSLEDAYLGIRRVHENKLLPEREKKDAWSTLQKYAGVLPSIKEYIQATQRTLKEQADLYCRGCGRQGSQGDKFCLECGRRIGRVDPPPELQQSP